MDRIDVLQGFAPRHASLGRELLAEADDAELQRIVEDAAKGLGTPFALVTLLLDEVQFFKAHTGLPPDLAAARGTRRDVSFCQYVVRDDAPFAISDAAEAEVPQYLVDEYGVRAYLGVPIHAADRVVGSLCVLDTRPRAFGEAEHAQLGRLAELVDERLRKMLSQRRTARLELSQRVTAPALVELGDALEIVEDLSASGQGALVAIRSALQLSAHANSGGKVSRRAIDESLETAGEALERIEDQLEDMRIAALDAEDSVVALEALMLPAGRCRLSEVLTAAQDLARAATREVGGSALPDLVDDPMLGVPKPFGVALMTAALGAVAARRSGKPPGSGIRIEVSERERFAEVSVTADGLGGDAIQEIAEELARRAGELPTVDIAASGGALRLAFRIA